MMEYTHVQQSSINIWNPRTVTNHPSNGYHKSNKLEIRQTMPSYPLSNCMYYIFISLIWSLKQGHSIN